MTSRSRHPYTSQSELHIEAHPPPTLPQPNFLSRSSPVGVPQRSSGPRAAITHVPGVHLRRPLHHPVGQPHACQQPRCPVPPRARDATCCDGAAATGAGGAARTPLASQFAIGYADRGGGESWTVRCTLPRYLCMQPHFFCWPCQARRVPCSKIKHVMHVLAFLWRLCFPFPFLFARTQQRARARMPTHIPIIAR